MKITPLAISEILLIQPDVYIDERGFFMETYKVSDFQKNFSKKRFVQQNHSGSHSEVLRGLHYQIKFPQEKLIQVITGEIYEVAVDIRANSATFGNWVGMNVSAKEHKLLWVPNGFAHGFYTLSKWAEIIYYVNNPYSPKWERTLLWNDDDLGITWPLASGRMPLLSKKDSCGKRFLEAEVYKK